MWLGSIWFYMGVAYFGLAAVTAALYWYNGRIVVQQERISGDEAIHQAEIKAAVEARIANCRINKPTLIKVNTFLSGVQEGQRIILLNSRSLMAATPKDNPLYTVRMQNYARQLKAYKKVSQLRQFHVPKVCK